MEIKMTELEIIKMLSGPEYRLYKLIEIWKDGWKSGTPHEDYVTDRLNLCRSGYFKTLKKIKEKGLL